MGKENKVAIYVRGGVIQSVISNNANIKVTIFDVDNLKAEGIEDREIDKKWDVLQSNMIHSI